MDDYYGVKEKGARIVALTRSWYSLSFTACISRWSRCAADPSSTAGGRLPVADRAAQLDVGRAVAGEPPLGQPGHAEVQVPRRLFRSQHHRRRGRPIGRRLTARGGSFGKHRGYPWVGAGVLRAQLPNKLGNYFPTRRSLRVGHIDKTTSGGRQVL